MRNGIAICAATAMTFAVGAAYAQSATTVTTVTSPTSNGVSSRTVERSAVAPDGTQIDTQRTVSSGGGALSNTQKIRVTEPDGSVRTTEVTSAPVPAPPPPVYTTTTTRTTSTTTEP